MFLVSHDRRFLDNVVTSTIAGEGDIGPAAGPPQGRAATPLGGPAPKAAGGASSTGCWREYEGGIADWRVQRGRMLAAQAAAPPVLAKPVSAAAPAPAAAAPAAKARKLSYKEKREFDELPGRIEALEAEQKALNARLADARLYADAPAEVPALQARHAQIDDELLAAMERWELLGG